MICENCNRILSINQIDRTLPYCSEVCRRKIYLKRKLKKEILYYLENQDPRLENYTIGKLKNLGFVVKVREIYMKDYETN